MKKLLAMALALLMVAVLLPVTAMAEGTLQAQIDEAETGATIALETDVTEDITIPANKNITIDLGGHTLKGKNSHTITNKGTLTIKGTGKVENTIGGKGALFNAVGATAYLNGGTFTGSTWYVIKNFGTMTIDGAEVIQNDSNSSAIANGWYANPDGGIYYPTDGSTANLTIIDGTFSGGMNIVKNDDYGTLKIQGGTFTNTDGPTVLNWNVATISGGSFTVNNTAKSVIANGYYDETADKGQLTITGGTFTASNNGTGVLFGYGCESGKGGSFSIAGGTFYGSPAVGDDYPQKPVVTGGTFSDVDGVKPYLADGLTTDSNGTVVEKQHTVIIIPDDSTDTTTTTEKPANPATGANDFVGAAAALAVVSLLGMAAITRKK
jgi:hypothetical protein